MQIVDEYRNRLQQATNKSEKAAIAAELHNMASAFDAAQRREYEEAMNLIHQNIETTLPDIDAAIEKARQLMATIEARREVRA